MTMFLIACAAFGWSFSRGTFGFLAWREHREWQRICDLHGWKQMARLTTEELATIRELVRDKYPESMDRWKQQRIAANRSLDELDALRTERNEAENALLASTGISMREGNG